MRVVGQHLPRLDGRIALQATRQRVAVKPSGTDAGTVPAGEISEQGGRPGPDVGTGPQGNCALRGCRQPAIPGQGAGGLELEGNVARVVADQAIVEGRGATQITAPRSHPRVLQANVAPLGVGAREPPELGGGGARVADRREVVGVVEAARVTIVHRGQGRTAIANASPRGDVQVAFDTCLQCAQPQLVRRRLQRGRQHLLGFPGLAAGGERVDQRDGAFDIGRLRRPGSARSRHRPFRRSAEFGQMLRRFWIVRGQSGQFGLGPNHIALPLSRQRPLQPQTRIPRHRSEQAIVFWHRRGQVSRPGQEIRM